MVLRWLSVAAVTLALAGTFAAPATAQETEGTTVVMLLTVAPGASEAEAEAAMKKMAAFVAEQPGLIEEKLLKSNFEGNEPSHIHWMRWRSLDDWMALSESPELMSLIEAGGPLFEGRPAEVFQPVR